MATKKTKPSNKPSGGWPKITQGTHLTVKTFEDGHTELEWDDEALLREVCEAIASVEVKPAKKKAAPKKAKTVEEPKTKRKTKEKQ